MILDAYVGLRLRQLRQNRRADRERVSSDLGIASDVLSEYELGQRTIPARLLFGLACHFDVRLEYFFEGYEPVMPHSLSPLPKGAQR